MLRFVVLLHQLPGGQSHYDWMFETAGEERLRTWAVDFAVDPGATAAYSCRLLAAHRRHYLDYQGPVSGDRGIVRQWDKGTYTVDLQAERLFEAQLQGQHLCGKVRFEFDHGPWRITWVPFPAPIQPGLDF